MPSETFPDDYSQEFVTYNETGRERDNARNNARCTQARKTTHGLDGQHQDVDRTPRGRVNHNDREQINGESTPMATEQNRTGRYGVLLTVEQLLKLLLLISFRSLHYLFLQATPLFCVVRQ